MTLALKQTADLIFEFLFDVVRFLGGGTAAA